jgi:hypothetical protein
MLRGTKVISVFTPARFALATMAVLSLVAVLLVSTAGVARADRPTVFEEDQTGFLCEYFAEGKPNVRVAISFDAVAGTGSSDAEVVSADGEVVLATGLTEDVQVGEGVVSARYPLLQHPDGPVIGEVILEGTYAPSGETVSFRPRFRTARNAQIIGTVSQTPLEVTWTTLQVGDFDISGITCEGLRSATTNRVLQPHRFVGFPFSELRLLVNCATDPLTAFRVEPSEVGVSLAFAVEGYEGFTNLNLADGSDMQSVLWSDEAGDLVEVTSITVTLTEFGHRRSEVQATPDGLILEQIQPTTLSYELVLPGGAGTITGVCGAESVLIRTAVEPVEEQPVQ